MLMSIVSKGLSKFMSCTVGMLDKFSRVKTLAKKLLSSSAFSLSVSVDVPSVYSGVRYRN